MEALYNKEDSTFVDYDHFIVTVNGSIEGYSDTPTTVKLSIGKMGGGNSNPAASFGVFLIFLLLVGVEGALLFFMSRFRKKMILDRGQPNSLIVLFTGGVGVVMFLAAVAIPLFGSVAVGMITQAEPGFSDSLGFFTIMIVFGVIGVCLFFIWQVLYWRCPRCRQYGDVTNLGSEYAGGETLTKKVNHETVGQKSTSWFNDYRLCNGCGNRWTIFRSEQTSWGDTERD